jgi:hypothetical protein
MDRSILSTSDQSDEDEFLGVSTPEFGFGGVDFPAQQRKKTAVRSLLRVMNRRTVVSKMRASKGRSMKRWLHSRTPKFRARPK